MVDVGTPTADQARIHVCHGFFSCLACMKRYARREKERWGCEDQIQIRSTRHGTDELDQREAKRDSDSGGRRLENHTNRRSFTV